MHAIGAGETVEKLGRYRIIQARRGYRFGADPIFLSDFALPISPGERCIDIGTGSCVIPLLLLQKAYIENKVVGVEVQDSLYNLAVRNLALNRGAADKVELLHADYRELRYMFKEGSFDLILSNPPYVKKGCGRVSHIKERAIARTELSGSLTDLVAISRYLLSKNGRVCYIYPAPRLREVMSVLELNGLIPRRLRLIYPSKGKTAVLFMVEASFMEAGIVVEEPLLIDVRPEDSLARIG